MRRHSWLLLLACLAGCGNDQPDGETTLAEVPSAAPAPDVSAALRPAPEADVRREEPPPRRPVVGETIAYGETAERNLTGFLALPEGSFEPPPGVLLIHDGRGLDDAARRLARRVAGEGFVVLAIDLYGNEVAASANQEQELVTRVMTQPAGALDNIRQGVEYLRRYALTPKVAVLGHSFGGTWSLQAALAFPDQLDAVVVYYGQVVTSDAQLRKLSSPLLAMYAGDDESIPQESVLRFRSALSAAGKKAAVRIYSGAPHDFADPASEHYRSADAEDAWGRVVEFLAAELNPDA